MRVDRPQPGKLAKVRQREQTMCREVIDEREDEEGKYTDSPRCI